MQIPGVHRRSQVRGKTDSLLKQVIKSTISSTRHYLERVLTQVPTRILGDRIRCGGDETSIVDCFSDYSEVTGESLASCPSSSGRPAAILCEQGYIQLGGNMKTSTRKECP